MCSCGYAGHSSGARGLGSEAAGWTDRARALQRAKGRRKGDRDRNLGSKLEWWTRTPAVETSNAVPEVGRGDDDGRGEEDCAVGPLKFGVMTSQLWLSCGYQSRRGSLCIHIYDP